MIVGRFEPASFFQRADNVALHAAASELFGWFARTLELPPQWAALVTRTTGAQEVVRAGGTIDGADAEGVLFVRTSPIDVSIEEPALTSRDGYSCRADIKLRLGIIPDRSELASFHRTVLGSRRVAQAAGLASLLQPTVGQALAKVVGEKPAADLVDSPNRDGVLDAVVGALNEACFSAGLTVERAPTLRFDSPAYRQVRDAQQRAATTRAEHEASRQVEEALRDARNKHLEHLSGLLDRLRGLANSAPDTALPDLIRTFTERQRGEIYEALFAAEAPTAQTAWIVVAAGSELHFFRPGKDETPARVLRVDGAAGPIRSVQTANDEKLGLVLLVGAATGIYRWPVDRAEPDLTLLVPDAGDIRGGFNSAVLAEGRIYAAHSELGLWEWDLGETGQCRRRLGSFTRDATAVRGVQAFDGDLLVGVDDQILGFRPAGPVDDTERIYRGSEATITSICPSHDGLFAGNAQGDVLHWPKGALSNPKLLHRGMNRAAESVGLLAQNGVSRLIFSDTSPRVHAMVLGDSFRCQYEAGGQTLRRVDIAPDLLVGTNDLRDRLFCWRPSTPAEPHQTIAVSRLCGHSIQDLCLVPVVA